jgi:MIP family channel proteins
MNKLLPGCIAEFIGTFGLIFFGVGSIVMAAGSLGGHRLDPGGTLVAVALAHGLALFVFISGTMYISGGQLNPAVSIGLVVAGKQNPAQAVAYIISQLLGATVAAWILLWAVGPDANAAGVDLGATAGELTRLGRTGPVFVLEMIGAFALVLSVLAATVDARAAKLGGLVIGLTVTMCILAIGPLTGASMNPARSFGPALVGGHWLMHWAYWLAPITGGVIAGAVYRTVWIPTAAR